jgi:hypothetical protein
MTYLLPIRGINQEQIKGAAKLGRWQKKTALQKITP